MILGNDVTAGEIRLFTGKLFRPLAPVLRDIHILDIAVGLGHACRFGGQICDFYSVAQHSVSVSLLCPVDDALWGLLHDASEAYLLDLPKPIKVLPGLQAYREAEALLMASVADKFQLRLPIPDSIKKVDQSCGVVEAQAFQMRNHPINDTGWFTGVDPGRPRLQSLPPNIAALIFLERFLSITANMVVGVALAEEMRDADHFLSLIRGGGGSGTNHRFRPQGG